MPSSAQLPISLILPTFNRLFILKDILPEYLALPVEEVVVVDDSSEDGTRDFLNSLDDGKLKVIHHEQRKYQPVARNSGIKVAAQPYILMGEDDVIMDSDYIIKLFERLQVSKADFIAGRLINMKRGENKAEALQRSNIENNKELFIKKSFCCNYSCVFDDVIETPFIHACSLFKSKWANDFQYFEKYTGNALREESDFYMQCYDGGAKMYFCSDAVAYHMFHDYAGGCWDTKISYVISGIRNNHLFLKRHWDQFKEAGGISQKHFIYELNIDLRLIKMTFLFWMSLAMPGIYYFLKKILKR